MFKYILPVVAWSTVYVILKFYNEMQVSILNEGDLQNKDLPRSYPHSDLRRVLPLTLHESIVPQSPKANNK